MIDRQNFVKICNQAIFDTRKNISIKNQVSGYQRFHREIKENNYFYNLRSVMKQNKRSNGYSLFFQHELIKHARMGNCHEIAEYLSVEIIQKLKDNVNARLRIVSSTEVDHVYLHIIVWLKDEKEPSLWEVDAWDPRIIDASVRPDGTIKNEEALDYGCHPKFLSSISTNKFTSQINTNYLFSIPRPIEGKPLVNATPEREITQKHEGIHDDYTLEEAVRNQKIDGQGKIHYLQQRSSWQF